MSKVEVNQISSQCGSTLTIGQSGDTVTLACGATQSGFGRTGTVDWDTTAKTASFTAVSGNGYFVNTTSGAVTVTMPATPSAGDIIGIKDYAGTFATNNVTVGRNGSNFDGVATDPILSTDQLSVFFVYVDGTQGWKATQSDSAGYGSLYVTATGGTVTCCGDYKIHTFTGPGTFCVSCAGNACGSNTVDYLVVAGGGGGGGEGGGGAAGGFRESVPSLAAWSASPLAAPGGALPVSVTGYSITVGGGGSGATAANAVGTSGSNSVFSSITSTGGGFGGSKNAPAPQYIGGPGGSGGGVGRDRNLSAGTGNTPPVSPPQGNPGGTTPVGASSGGGGGGGATAAGSPATSPGETETGGPGGAGAATSITSSPVTYSGGGGGGSLQNCAAKQGTGGSGGGGNAAHTNATSGTTNTGGGGGGYGSNGASTAGSGGSGIVIIRYKFQ